MNTTLSVALHFKHFDIVKRLIDLGVVNLKGFVYEEPKAKGRGND
jgi:hypothetical protein